MTDLTADTAPATEATATPTEDIGSSRRGRPRPESTIERDKQVLAIVNGANGVTRSQIAAELGIDGNTAYLSLHRLRKDGKVQNARSGTDHVWVVADAPAA